jgi:Arc/MetJ family transcription regulator
VVSRAVIDLDDHLVADVAQALGTSTTKQTVDTAVREVLESRRRGLALGRLPTATDERGDGEGWRGVDEVVIPRSFLEMPRWWSEGGEWLEELPGLVGEQCRRWGLRLEAGIAHGSNAVVVPVSRGDEELVLRLAPPGDETAEQAEALRFWDGRGTVRVVDADPGRGAMLLERLEMGRSLVDVPVREAVTVLGRMMRRLAVPAPVGVR